MRTAPRSTFLPFHRLALVGSLIGLAAACDSQNEPESVDADALIDDRPLEDVELVERLPAEAEPIDESSGPVAPPVFGIERDPVAFTFKGWANDTYPPVTCGTGQIASGSGCSDNCTYVGLECHNYGGVLGESHWSNFISEELPNNFHQCPTNQYVTGISCTGGWCDNVSVECTETSFAKNNCYWTDPITNWMNWLPDGQAVAGVSCAGGHCSSMRFYICSI